MGDFIELFNPALQRPQALTFHYLEQGTIGVKPMGNTPVFLFDFVLQYSSVPLGPHKDIFS